MLFNIKWTAPLISILRIIQELKINNKSRIKKIKGFFIPKRNIIK